MNIKTNQNTSHYVNSVSTA